MIWPIGYGLHHMVHMIWAVTGRRITITPPKSGKHENSLEL